MRLLKFSYRRGRISNFAGIKGSVGIGIGSLIGAGAGAAIEGTKTAMRNKNKKPEDQESVLKNALKGAGIGALAVPLASTIGKTAANVGYKPRKL